MSSQLLALRRTFMDRYAAELGGYVATPEEKHLAVVAKLGRELVLADVPPEEMVELHDEGLRRLAEAQPDVSLGDVAHLISAPLIEMAMAYGLAFREREEDLRKYRGHLQELVAERTAQLEATNKELEAFAYSVSHDLRGPLRAIDGFSRILEEENTAQLDAEGRRLLGVVRENTGLMAQLIEDLLELSRVGRRQLESGAVDMKPLVEEILKQLRQEHPERQFRVILDGLPPAIADSVMLRQVWVNLLSNAIKFTSSQESATITIGGVVDGAENVYSVKDNGAGFDMQYVGKLFGLFQRLHSRDEFKGTGVGLAIVKRIVERHGGRVWAEGKANEGASFSFALPNRGGETNE